MEKVYKILCALCRKPVYRTTRRFNENKKLEQDTYCSLKCLAEARKKRKILVCENKKCKKEFIRPLSAVSSHNYCSISCAVHINNQQFPKRGPGFKICFTCKQHFKVDYQKKYCSVHCVPARESRYSQKEVINFIRVAAKKLGRVPSKRELREVVGVAVHVFGSWNKAVSSAGFVPNRSHDHRMYKRVVTRARDGHLCDSISEALVDNWLSSHGIEHSRDIQYPEGHYKADWKVGKNIFVEYFGLAKDSPRYDRSIKTKQDICKQQGIQLVEVYANDLYPVNMLNEKLHNLVHNP